MRRVMTAIVLAASGLACTPGGGGSGGGDDGEAPRCIAPQVACEADWLLMRSWSLPNVDGTDWVEAVGRTWDDPTPPTEGARLRSHECAPEASIDDFERWDDMAVEQFGYYVTVTFWSDGSVDTVREYDANGLVGFDCEMGASRAHRSILRPIDGEAVVTEYPQNLSGADGSL